MPRARQNRRHLSGARVRPSPDKVRTSQSFERFGVSYVEGTEQELEELGAPVLLKTHDLPTENARPAVVMVRDGRDAIVSYGRLALYERHGILPGDVEIEQLEAVCRDLILERHSPFGTWCESIRRWSERPNSCVVRYEDLCRDPAFEELRAMRPAVMFRGEPGGWERDFSPELLELFLNENGEMMSQLGYL